MSNWVEKLEKLIEEQKKHETPLDIEGLSRLSLAEFSRRDMAVEIYSEILGREVWLCSNAEMVLQIKDDLPGAICYTAKELREIVKLNPSPEDLKQINEAKTTFPASTVIKSETKEGLLDLALSEMDREFPADLYAWIDSNDKELSSRIASAENKINAIFRSGSAEELRAALKEYRELHREARTRMKK
jgi:hypothetical protein